MLARYRIVRGKRPPAEPLPEGRRIDTRKHTSHVLRPTEAMVTELLAEPDSGWPTFRERYERLLDDRFAADSAPFDELAEMARSGDVHLGCNCPTKRQPDVMRCHTVLALAFMRERYPDLVVVLPNSA